MREKTREITALDVLMFPNTAISLWGYCPHNPLGLLLRMASVQTLCAAIRNLQAEFRGQEKPWVKQRVELLRGELERRRGKGVKGGRGGKTGQLFQMELFHCQNISGGNAGETGASKSGAATSRANIKACAAPQGGGAFHQQPPSHGGGCLAGRGAAEESLKAEGLKAENRNQITSRDTPPKSEISAFRLSGLQAFEGGAA